MPGAPEVSIVIPLYNKGLYIARALKSVLAQTVQDFEVIVVDGDSTDDGTTIVRGFNDSRIRVVRQDNKGVSDARNKGIDESRAELVAFLDADDEWLPNFIETILRLYTLHPDAGLFGTAYEVHFPGSIIQRVYNKSEGERIISYFGALVDFGNNLFYPSSSAAPKKILKEVEGYPPGVKWAEDTVLWGKIALQFPIVYSPEVCAIYYQYTSNNSTGITEYLEHPFLHYISTISRDKLIISKYTNVKDLMEYCDACRLATVSRNIYSGYGARARIELSPVKSSRYIWKKYKLQLLSYIPKFGISFIRKYSKVLSYFKHKIFH